jgi:hypothetical protein
MKREIGKAHASCVAAGTWATQKERGFEECHARKNARFTRNAYCESHTLAASIFFLVVKDNLDALGILMYK